MTLDHTTQILLLDDDEDLRDAVSQSLELAGFGVRVCSHAKELMVQLTPDWPGIVISDIRMPDINGMELLDWLQKNDPDLPVLLITGFGDVPLAVQAMRAGAYDFLQKPFVTEQLIDSARRALERRRLILENRTLRQALSDRTQLHTRLLGQSPAMCRLREQVKSLAATDADILILGETGSGKEVVARTLHQLSPRRDGPFVAINAGALARSMVESELFGHEAGAFTGAIRQRIGKFEHANHGTVFLDEIESMSLDVQIKLLRLLQERVVERIGSNDLIPLDIRVIAASKEDLQAAARQGQFRTDLYYRLNVAQVQIPPLRDRSEDILTLFRHFAEQASSRHGLPVRDACPKIHTLLLSHHWPGNVRELQNAAERFALGLELSLSNDAATFALGQSGLTRQVEAFERAVIAAEMARHHTSLRTLAEALELPRKTLHDKMKRHNLHLEKSGEKSP